MSGTNAFPGGWFGLERRADVMSGNIYEPKPGQSVSHAFCPRIVGFCRPSSASDALSKERGRRLQPTRTRTGPARSSGA